MLRHLPSPFRVGLLLIGAALVTAPAPLAAQDADFMFRRPRVNLAVNLGWAMPSAGSDIFDETRDLFGEPGCEPLPETDLCAPLDLGSFNTFHISGEVAYRATERVDVGLELGFDRSEVHSEDREFVGTDDLPIAQTTTLRRMPLTVNVKGYLNERGRSISRFAWVPNRWSPWLGAGAGVVHYMFEREGEFVDYETLEIFRDRVVSEGSGPTFHVMGGADVSLGPHFLLTGQLRYSWANAELDPFYYQGYEDIDLGGLRATGGIKVRF